MNIVGVLSKYSKFIAAAIGAITMAINYGILPHQSQSCVAIIISILTALGVAGVPNSPSTASETKAQLSDHETRLASVEAQLPAIPDMSKAVSAGVVSALRALGHTSDTPPPRTQLKAEAVPDAPDPTKATPADILASVEPTVQT